MKLLHRVNALILLVAMQMSAPAEASLTSISSFGDGGLVYLGLPDESVPDNIVSFEFQTGATSSYEYVEIPAEGMFNRLTWNFDATSGRIRSEMSGTGNVGEGVAWVGYHWVFNVENKPIPFAIEASVPLMNTRFMQYAPGSNDHVCLSPGCEGDNLAAGRTTGLLDPGYSYVLEFSPSVEGYSSFRFQVPEPDSLLLMATGLVGTIFMHRRKKAINPLLA